MIGIIQAVKKQTIPVGSPPSKETDNTRWKSSKTIYDPCPPGYRVPDGGYNGYDGFWAKAFGENRNFKDEGGFDSANKGFNFGSSGKGNAKLSNSASTCWYPAAGTTSASVLSATVHLPSLSAA